METNRLLYIYKKHIKYDGGIWNNNNNGILEGVAST